MRVHLRIEGAVDIGVHIIFQTHLGRAFGRDAPGFLVFLFHRKFLVLWIEGLRPSNALRKITNLIERVPSRHLKIQGPSAIR